MNISDVTFTKCKEYAPYSDKADKLGMKTFWRADYNGETLAIADTKAECVKEARTALRRMEG